MQKGTVSVSVRQMVEFILRSGDIDISYRGSSRGSNRALDGTRIHQKLQKSKKKEAKKQSFMYKSEVVLATACTHKGIDFRVEGRADGIMLQGDTVTIEEIKSTLRPVAQLLPDPGHWHWAQAKCYGYMYGKMLADGDTVFSDEAVSVPDGVTIALTYCQVETEEVRTLTEFFSFDALAAFFFDLLERYWDFANMDLDRLAARNASAKALDFPYGAYRAGQRELAVAVYTTVKQKRKLFAQAPTGIGKTISTLFPAVKSLAEGYGEKIFYLTAKAIARQVAEEAFRHMTAQGLCMRVITITARDKICFAETRQCDPEHCRYANGHFDRVNNAILDCVRHEIIITREMVEDYARRHQVCPAEYQLDIALFCDTVIGDYNHAYDPKAKLQRFFQQGGDYILLNDEAHNLIDRARDMFSTGLYRHDFTSLRKTLGRKHPLYKGMGLIAREIKQQWENTEPFCRNEQPQSLLPLLLDFAQACDIWLQQNANDPFSEPLLTLYFNALDYLRVSELFDERYAFYCEPANGYIKLLCLDPSELLRNEQKKSRACVFFSATLTPLPFFRTVLGGSLDDFVIRLAQPFPRSNLCLLVDDRISTKFKDREHFYDAVAERLFDMVAGRIGNYMAFFPSYAYLNAVYARFADQYPEVMTLVQSQDMADESRESFLAHFNEQSRTLLAFVVLGGVFSEGIDLKGDRLIGAAIVSVGLPQISAERNVIMDYYNRFDRCGFDFAYVYPGMNKVMQAAGRVIRTETDRGIVLLIDTRYRETQYRSLFPPEWQGYTRLIGMENAGSIMESFWNTE